jgi:hypothetical protein
MEDPSLWLPVFGYEYRCNADFDDAMRIAYSKKVKTIAQKRVQH